MRGPVRMRAACAAVLAVLGAATHAGAQDGSSPDPDEAFAARRWHAEFSLAAAVEAWNDNVSHEELYGLLEGVTYGLRDGLVLTARQRTYYVSGRRAAGRPVAALRAPLDRIRRRLGRLPALRQVAGVWSREPLVPRPNRGQQFLPRLRPKRRANTRVTL